MRKTVLLVNVQVTISDPEIGLPNLVEAKHHALARSFRDTPTDRDLKPNAGVRDRLNTISGYVRLSKYTISFTTPLVLPFKFHLSCFLLALPFFHVSFNDLSFCLSYYRFIFLSVYPAFGLSLGHLPFVFFL